MNGAQRPDDPAGAQRGDRARASPAPSTWSSRTPATSSCSSTRESSTSSCSCSSRRAPAAPSAEGVAGEQQAAGRVARCMDIAEEAAAWRRARSRSATRARRLVSGRRVACCPAADDTRALGRAGWARLLRAGDLVVLTGGLGAGKTTLTQGHRRRAGRARAGHLADVRHRPGAPVDGRRPGARARRRLPARRVRSSSTTSTSTPRRRQRHRRRVGHGLAEGLATTASRSCSTPAPTDPDASRTGSVTAGRPTPRPDRVRPVSGGARARIRRWSP